MSLYRFRNLILSFVSVCSIVMPSMAQQTNSSDIKPEDAGKLIEQQKKEIENDKDMDPQQKAMLLKMLNGKMVKDVTRKLDHADSKTRAAFELGEEMTALPTPDKTRLAGISAKPLSKAQLVQYLTGLSVKLNATVDAATRTSANNIFLKAKGNGASLRQAALVAWYNGHPEEGLLLAVKAASLSYEINALNNLGAMLDLIGHEEKAVPLLQYALRHDSTNASVLNNLGRAWLGLGEKDKARKMFINCIHFAPRHPEANNSLGCLYEAAGDKANAEASFKKSLEGGYNETAYKHLSKLDPDFDIVVLVGQHHKAPAYFNQFKIKLPDECYHLEESKTVSKKLDLFQQEMDRLTLVYSPLLASDVEKNDEQLKAAQNTIMAGLSEGKAVKMAVPPLMRVAGLMLAGLHKEYIKDTALANKDYRDKINLLLEKYHRETERMTASFKAQYRYGEGGELGHHACLNCEQVNRQMCKALHAVANEYQGDAASLNQVYRDRYHRLLLNYFDDFVYWGQLYNLTGYGSNAAFYQTVIDFLIEMKMLSYKTPLLDDPCPDPNAGIGNVSVDKYEANAKPQCPISLVLAFGVGKLSLDCSSMSISGGELIQVGYKHDFTSGQSTLSAGAGISVNVGVGAVTAGAGAGETIYVTFDGNGNPMDAGIKTEAGVSAQAGALSTGASMDVTLSMNAGFDFTPSGLSNSITL
ncbi:MAG TPA: tetratricopeptide repeat protein [Puia sp.]|nr:tetratricopeptide repeat protein [Puia sp.]